MLALEKVTVALGDFRLAADWAVAAGSATALIGPSGSGKSTLLGLVAGFVAPVAGRVLWEGRDLAPVAPAERPVTLLFQEHNLFAHLTAAQNVGLGLRPDLRLGREGWDRVEAALAAVGLAGLGQRRPAGLSGGQRQRVALARALLRARPVLMLDEPFAALGPGLRAEMLDLVARIREEQEATLLIVTHAPEDARRIAGQVVFVEGGTAHPPVPTERLFAEPPAALRRYLGDGEVGR
jgi:thiamine transport system ATP-binding protein